MAKLYLFLVAVVALLKAAADTEQLDAEALQDLYRSLNSPRELSNWQVDSGDPCEDAWLGVTCFGSSVVRIDLQGLELKGNLGQQLSNLRFLKILDLSSNKIEGSIPQKLPPRVVVLNLSHNALSGYAGDGFNGLYHMREMDLSSNRFSGELPKSFSSLTNLTELFLQNNQFTGTVNILGKLSLLTTLNIEDNHFSGVIPESFQAIKNLRISFNDFKTNLSMCYCPRHLPSNSPSAVMIAAVIVIFIIACTASAGVTFVIFRHKPNGAMNGDTGEDLEELSSIYSAPVSAPAPAPAPAPTPCPNSTRSTQPRRAPSSRISRIPSRFEDFEIGRH